MSWGAALPDSTCLQDDLGERKEELIDALWQSLPPGTKPTKTKLRQLIIFCQQIDKEEMEKLSEKIEVDN